MYKSSDLAMGWGMDFFVSCV